MLLLLSVGGAAQQLSFCVDVSLKRSTLLFDGPADSFGDPATGACFFVEGVVYPAGTFAAHGANNGLLPDGSAEFPADSIGKFYDRGWFIRDYVNSSEGLFALTKHVLVATKDYLGLGAFSLVSSGGEPGATGEAFQRAVNGGTDTMKVYKGIQIHTQVGINATGGRNVTLCFDLSNLRELATPVKEVHPAPAPVSLSVQPNPINGSVATVVAQNGGTAAEGMLRLTDAQGKIYRQAKWQLMQGENAYVLPVDGMPAGVYTLTWSNGTRHVSSKLVVTR